MPSVVPPAVYLTDLEFHKIGVILKAIPEDAIAAIQFVENEERENLTAVETAEHVMTLKNTLKWPDADIATKLGWGNKRIVGMYLTIAEAPPWLKMHAVPVAHEVVKRDKNGEILRSSDGTRQMTTIVGAALGMTHLYELMRFFREAEKYDKSSNSDHAPIAQQLTQRFASKASLEEWSKARLKTALDDQLVKLTGIRPEGGDDVPSGPPIFTVGKTRINIDVSKLGSPLPKPRLVEMKPDLVEVLTKLGFKNVLLGIE